MSSSNNDQINIPQAREAMDRFKMLIRPGSGRQPAERLKRPPDLPGSVGGQMVRNVCPHMNREI